MSTVLSDMPLANNLIWDGVFVPFIAFLKADPPAGLGKRIEIYRWYEVRSALIEDALDTICATDGYDFDFVRPVSFTPQFGQKTGRFTVTGNLCRKPSWLKQPIEDVNVDYESGIKTGYDASNLWNMIPKADLDVTAKDFKALLESTLSGLNMKVIKLDIANYIYGVKGSHFPL